MLYYCHPAALFAGQRRSTRRLKELFQAAERFPAIGRLIGPGSGAGTPLFYAYFKLTRFAQEGCGECLEALFRRYYKLVLNIGWKVLHHQSEAEDLAQEVFISILLKRNVYDEARSLPSTWIAQLAYFKALMRRRNVYTRILAPVEQAISHEEEERIIGSSWCDQERIRLVEECLASLKPRQRRTIELIHFEGYTLQECSNVIKESLANTRNQYYRGMQSLKLLLQAKGAPQGIPAASRQAPVAPAPAKSFLPLAET